MGAIALAALILMMLHGRSSSSSPPALPPSSSTPQHPVARAHEHARRTRQRAAETGKPEDVKAANAAAAAAQKATQQQKATTMRTSSPSPTPQGLPAFPAGWEPDNPPPQAVQARASALLPVLWKKGAGATSTEKTAGRWITYQAAVTSPGKKGVVAFRVKPSAMASANA